MINKALFEAPPMLKKCLFLNDRRISCRLDFDPEYAACVDDSLPDAIAERL